MSLWSRIANVFRGERVNREIDEEIESHIAEAIEQGRETKEARRAFGSPLRTREQSRDARVISWLDSLRADTIFAWRQIRKRKVTSAAAIVSLGLAMGACTTAFRLIDALLLRPLPVAGAERLYYLARRGVGFDGKFQTIDDWAYPAFERMRDAVKDQAELFAISYAVNTDLTYRGDEEMEKARRQYVSGRMFSAFGLRPAVGRLLNAEDDDKPGAHPVAVLSRDYWKRRFGADPAVVGRTFHIGDAVYEIAGVIDGKFTGTEPGTVVDMFLPTMMNPAATHDDQTWIRTLVRMKPGVAMEPVRAKLEATSRAFERERARGFTGMTKESIEQFINQAVVMEPAAAGASELQHSYERPLWALAIVVALVLLIACANAANLMTAQAATRAREMALRVSIGAGRWRLTQLVLVESIWIALLAGAAGAALAWWAAPFVVNRINPSFNPARLDLPADWRVTAFGVALTLVVSILFGLTPALRASAVKPSSALKGGEHPGARRLLMHSLIAAQAAFCFLVLFIAGLFAATFERLVNQPMGFSADRLLTLQTVAPRGQTSEAWEQVAEQVRAVPGVEAVAVARWALLTGSAENHFLSIHGAPPGPVLAYFLNVSPGWLHVMKMDFAGGRDFRAADTSPGTAVVNETFVKTFFNGGNAIGEWFTIKDDRYQVVGVVRDAPYRSLREPTLPVAFVPLRAIDARGNLRPISDASMVVRTANADPWTLAGTLQRMMPHFRAGFRVSSTRTQEEINQTHTVRERLLAWLALFFAMVALALAGIGLYGVLDYSVLQRYREIGIRVAIGAPAGDIARRVAGPAFAMVVVGAASGLGIGMASVHFIAGLLYGVEGTEPSMLVLPALAITGAAVLAALPAVMRALRIDPAILLRSE